LLVVVDWVVDVVVGDVVDDVVVCEVVVDFVVVDDVVFVVVEVVVDFVVVEVVVTGEGDHHSPGHANGEEYLSASIRPNIDVHNLIPLRCNVVCDAVHKSWQCGSPY